MGVVSLKRKKKSVVKPTSKSIDKADKTPSRPMMILAGGLLFGAWLNFLYPWVAYQFWQSDTFWLIEIGRLILEKHCLPAHDIYSYTSTASPWIVYQWLPEVIFSLANNIAGLIGVAIVGAQLLAILCCVLIFRRMIKEEYKSCYRSSRYLVWSRCLLSCPCLPAPPIIFICFILASSCSLCRHQIEPAI